MATVPAFAQPLRAEFRKAMWMMGTLRSAHPTEPYAILPFRPTADSRRPSTDDRQPFT